MIRRLIARLMPGSKAPRERVYGPHDHPIRRDQLSRGALEVIRKLQHAGYKAYVVGGAVRDLLLGKVPKDFDVATDATPEEVKPLFRRARIIGRRFRLVHVHVGAETIEVSTFRAAQTRRRTRPTSTGGCICATTSTARRRRTPRAATSPINALYYDPADETSGTTSAASPTSAPGGCA